MKTKYRLVFVSFITLTVLVSSCKKTDTNLASENAQLKARVQQLEEQLKEAGTAVPPQATPESSQASVLAMKSQLDEAQKKAESTANDLKANNAQLATQQQKIDDLTGQLSAAQQAADKAEKDLQLSHDKSAALMQLQALRSTLADEMSGLNRFLQSYAAAQPGVTKLAARITDSKVQGAVASVWAVFTRINDTCKTAAAQMDERTKIAQANYDKFVDFGGMGPNDYVIAMGKEKILGPAKEDNAATAATRDEQVISLKKDLDLALKNLEALVNGQSS